MHRTNTSVKGGRLNFSEANGDPIIVGSPAWYDCPLIRTKLCHPRIGSDVITRTHLIERLNAGLSSKITLLSAPNGFGKTTLLVEWLETCDRPIAWLTLDENDNDLSAFVLYLTAALQTIFPDACQATASLLKAPQSPPPDLVATLLTNDLADVPENVILVLDNYHTIHQDAVHTLLDLLIRYIPPQVHLVLSTRSDPPLPLTRWRAQGQLNEFYGVDLRFKLDETKAFLTRIVGDELPQEAVSTLEEQTEGWIAMLRLAAHSLRGASDPVALVESLRNHPDRYVSSYLLEEILAQQAPTALELLIQLSILDRFCAALCEATISTDSPRQNVQAFLDSLEHTSVFISPLDDQAGWYRLHPLFRCLLGRRLQECFSKEEIAALHQRAGSWYATEGYIKEAIEHALAAGGLIEAVHLVEAQFRRVLEHEQWVQMENWLHLLPEKLIQSRPCLLVARAWILQVHGQLEGVPHLLTAAREILETSGSSVADLEDSQVRFLRAVIALLWSFFQHLTGQPQASMESARSALEWIPPGEMYLANLALYYQSLANQLTGHEDVARFELNNALREPSTNLNGTVRLLFAQALIYLNAGKLRQLEQASRHLLRLAQEANLPVSQNWAHWLLGYVHYEWNQLDTARHHFSTVVTNMHHAHFCTVREAMYGLALTYLAQGLPARAKETTDALLESLREQNNICALLGVYSFHGQMALLQDEAESAEQWVEMVGEHWVTGPMTSFEVPPITKAWTLLATGDESNIAQGQMLLTTLLRYVESIHNTRKTIQVLALQALAYDLQGCMTKALDVLERAIALAYPGGFIRTFANLPPLVKLLRELRKRRKSHQAVDRKLDAYLQRLLIAMSPTSPSAVSKEDLMRQEGLEPLTDRELQILHLLDMDLTNKEIARKLVVTAGTVKVHTNNVYRKLSVNNRRSAVALSKALGILAAD
ncbi:MAG TPA: LuxR C-terminal-related transcriptional regulator [Ktedonobacteraceae bacterium]